MGRKLLDNFKDQEIVQSLVKEQGSFVANSILEEALVIASAYYVKPKKYLIVKNNLYQAQRLFEYLSYFLGEESVTSFFFDETLRIEALSASKELLSQRLDSLNTSLKEEPRIIVTHTLGYIRHLPSRDNFVKFRKVITTREVISREKLIKSLTNAGYKRVSKISNPLEFSSRGAIIDFYSVNYEDPVRIEFFDDEIDSIRFFDINTQRTKEVVEEVEILPGSEFIVTSKDIPKAIEEKLKEAKIKLAASVYEELEFNINKDIESLLSGSNNPSLAKYYELFEEVNTISDYFNPDICLLLDKVAIEENFLLLEKEMFEYQEELFWLGKSLNNLKPYKDLGEVHYRNKRNLSFKNIVEDKGDLSIDIKGVSNYQGNSKLLAEELRNYLSDGYKVYVYLNNQNQIETFKTILNENKINSDNIKIINEMLIEGFVVPFKKEVYLSSKEIYGVNKFTSKYFNKYKSAREISGYEDLNIGDYLVHDNYGIAVYKGLKTIKSYNSVKDYLHLAYKNNESLYVPLEQFSMVRKYVGAEGRIPTLNKLGSDDWEKTKNKIKGKVKELAIDLISLYEKRTKKIGFAFSKDDEIQEMFENAFVYEPTKDQKNAIKRIKEEMEKEEPADILLCGDVGFGKTEVAFVAAFKAIRDNKQVAILCPTTLLSSQHYSTAIERFENFGVRVALLNRFKSAKEQKEILKDLRSGKVDILIGTHRILSSDVRFKDLGLLVVDEEQRFGVEHKEKIKELKNEIDVLTLSATPIPRTMQMALIGIRTLIQLDTPPSSRMPIQTYVIEKDFRVIREIIERELARNGQVFYLYNKTSDIHSLARKIEEEISGSRVGVIHGKMDKDIIEEVSFGYYNNNINVLVCTTIIENGIDVANANTIIVENADKFGLSQLYQIKGRVGRGDRLAYAYLLVNPRKQMSEVASKRLKAIKEFSELGSGYKIALKDLSIRGAGDIVGAKQAGFIDNIGMDLYIDLLREAIEEEQGVIKEKEKELVRLVQTKGYIPLTYSESESNKIDIYKKLEAVKDLGSLVLLRNEVADLYGKIPNNVELLLEKRKTEILLSKDDIKEVRERNDYIDIIMSKELSNKDGIGVVLFDIVNKLDYKNISLSFLKDNIRIRINKKNVDWLSYINKILIELEI